MPKSARRPRAQGVSTLATILIALAAAMLTAFAAAAIHIVKMSQLRAALEGKSPRFLKYTRAMSAGEKLESRDVVAEVLRPDDAQALGSLVDAESLGFVLGRRLRQSVKRGEWVQWAHLTTGGYGPPPRTDMVGIMFELDPRKYPPGCKAGDHVNILAEIQTAEDAAPRVFRIIRNVKVLATGSSAGIGPDTRPRADRSDRSVTVEVSTEVALPLQKLLKLAKGSAWLEVLPPDAPFDLKRDGIINPDEPILKRLVEREGQARPSTKPATRGEPKDRKY